MINQPADIAYAEAERRDVYPHLSSDRGTPARTKDLIATLYWGEPTGSEMARVFSQVRAMNGCILETITRKDNKGATIVVRMPWSLQWSVGMLLYVSGTVLEYPEQEGE